MTTTYFLSDGNDEIAEYDGAGALVTRYVPGPAIDDPIAMVPASGSKSYFHENKQGSVIAMSGASAALAEGPYTYDPYGNCVAGGSACSSGEPYRFTGRRFDPETGLSYYRARYYSSVLGRFLQTDPVGYTADLDLYTYVGNEPVDKMDPDGLAPGDWFETREEAGVDAIDYINPISINEHIEFAGRLYQSWFTGNWSYTAPLPGDAAHSNRGDCIFFNCKDAYHTHGGTDAEYNNEVFSAGDMQYAEAHGYPIWLGTPFGRIRIYDPGRKKGDKIITLRGRTPSKTGNSPPDVRERGAIQNFPLHKDQSGSGPNKASQGVSGYSQGHCPGASPGLSCGLGGSITIWN